MKNFYSTFGLIFLLIISSCGPNHPVITNQELIDLVSEKDIHCVTYQADSRMADIEFPDGSVQHYTIADSNDQVDILSELKRIAHHKSFIVVNGVSNKFGQRLFILLAIPIILNLFLFIYALVIVLKNNFNNPNDKLVWLAIIFLLPLIGSILFLTIGRKQISSTSL